MFLMTHRPPGDPRNKPTDVRMTADTSQPGSGAGIVLTQDIRVVAGLQRGLHQPGLTHLLLSNEERRVIDMHRNLERHLFLLPECERMRRGATGD